MGAIYKKGCDWMIQKGAPYLLPMFGEVVKARERIEADVVLKPDPWLPSRMLDLKLILRRRKPSHIVEFGSGMSTILFASYCSDTGSKLLSLEENAEWIDLTSKGLEAAGFSMQPTKAEKKDDGETVFFDYEIPVEADLLFVDGPSTNLNGQKAVCADVLRALHRGLRPRTIVVSGRATTAKAIADYCEDYSWAVGSAKQIKVMPNYPVRIGHHAVATLNE